MPMLDHATEDRARRRKRLVIWPFLALLMAVWLWWRGDQNAASMQQATHAAVEALVTGVVEQGATRPTTLHLRWGNDAMTTTFHAGIKQAVTDGTWTVQVRDADAPGSLPVHISGGGGAVRLVVKPAPGTDLATITSVAIDTP